MATQTAPTNGSGAPVGAPPAPAGTPAAPRNRVLPAQVGGLIMLGTLAFAGTTSRNQSQCAIDLTCRDIDGRQEVFKASGWIDQKDGERRTLTPLGKALRDGVLNGLIGSEVAVIVRPRVWRETVQWEVDGIFPVGLA